MKKGGVTGDGSNSYLKYGLCGVQGKRRKMEDRHDARVDIDVSKYKVNNDISFFGVYDGHGGDETADKVERQLTNQVFTQDVEPNDTFLSDSFLIKGFLDCDANIRKDENITSGVSGSTAVTSVIVNKKDEYEIICANVGDSRGILYHNGKTTAISKDHKPTKPKEKKRIEDSGHCVLFSRVDGSLGVARSFGDFRFKNTQDLPQSEQAVTALPEIKRFTVSKQEQKDKESDYSFVILACDGVWDVMKNEEVSAFFVKEMNTRKKKKNWKLSEICLSLLKKCILELGSQDNCTVELILFKEPERK